MRLATFLEICLAGAVACAATCAAAWAQGVPLPYAPGPGPRGIIVRPMPMVRGPFLRPPRGPFAMPLAHGPFAGPAFGPFIGPPGPYGGPRRDALVDPMPVRRFDPPAGRICFSPAETREKIISYRLTEPFEALRLGRWNGEALRARLCRWPPERFIYEIAVLRRDGRIVHVYMNAKNGQSVRGSEDPGNR